MIEEDDGWVFKRGIDTSLVSREPENDDAETEREEGAMVIEVSRVRTEVIGDVASRGGGSMDMVRVRLRCTTLGFGILVV